MSLSLSVSVLVLAVNWWLSIVTVEFVLHLSHVPPWLCGLLQFSLHLHFKVQGLHILKQFLHPALEPSHPPLHPHPLQTQYLFNKSSLSQTIWIFPQTTFHPYCSISIVKGCPNTEVYISCKMYWDLNMWYFKAGIDGISKYSWSLLPDEW